MTNLEEADAGTDPLLADTDGDGFIDGTDTCPAIADPAQLDGDGDRRGDACDNCIAAFNASQIDVDTDGEGDACDLDDGRLYWVEVTIDQLTWQPEADVESFNVYRGELARLQQEGAAAIMARPR